MLAARSAPVVVASHPRSGTHLLMDFLRRQFEACQSWKWWGERLDRLYCSIDELNASRGRLDEATAYRILSRTERPLVKTHAWPNLNTVFLEEHHDGLPDKWRTWLTQNGTFLYVLRDVRTVMASYQMFRRRFDNDAKGSLSAFVRGSDTPGDPNRIAQWAQHVQAWQDLPNSHLFRFEDLIHDTQNQLDRLATVLEETPIGAKPLLPPPFESIWGSRMARLFSTRPDSTAIIGVDTQDWEEHLTTEDQAFIVEVAGDVMREFNYL